MEDHEMQPATEGLPVPPEEQQQEQLVNSPLEAAPRAARPPSGTLSEEQPTPATKASNDPVPTVPTADNSKNLLKTPTTPSYASKVKQN
jgi:hypothetical protein